MPDVKNTLQSYSAELENKNIEVVEHKCTRNLDGQKCTTCVLGVLLSDHGKQIEQYMLSWLTKKYNVISVRQPLPGSLFEYPALRYAQLFSIGRIGIGDMILSHSFALMLNGHLCFYFSKESGASHTFPYFG